MENGFILKQPNGLYCIINDINKVLRYNLTSDKIIEEYVYGAATDIRTKIRIASDLKDEHKDALLKAALTDNERIKLTRIFTEMDAPAKHDEYSRYSGYIIEIKFKTDYLKNNFVYGLRYSVLTEERLNNYHVVILSETDTSITFCAGSKKYDKFLSPFISCKYNDRNLCAKYTDTVNRNEYEFIIKCPNHKLAELTYDSVLGQFSITDDFNQNKISVDKIGNSIIILFDIESNFCPVFTLIERKCD